MKYHCKQAAGVCVHHGCIDAAAPNRARCSTHLALIVQEKENRRIRKLREKKCAECSKPSAKGRTRCTEHLLKHTADNRRRYEIRSRGDITPDEMKDSLIQQGGHCWFCPLTGKHFGRNRFHLDRDHAHGCPDHDDSKVCSKCFRGHLCYGHNVWLGSMEKTGKTTPELDEYLKRRPILEMRKTGKTAEEMSIWVTNKVVLMRI